MFFQKEIETMSRPEIEKVQLQRLQATVERCYNNVPFYRERFDSIGVKPEDIRSLSDIAKIPYTMKDDIRQNYPFNMFAAKMRDVVRIHASSGTTGKPTVVGYTKKDLDTWSTCVARLACAAGATPDDIAQIAFGYGLFTGALGLHYGLEKIGCAVIPMSSGNSEKQLMLMEDFGTTLLVATPSYAVYLSELAKEKGITERLKLRLGLFGSEGCTPEMRAKIEENFPNLLATDNYGMSELMGPGVAGECELRCGLHIAEDHFLCEIINPETGEPMPEGEYGELVVTPLTKEAFPVLRYRTRDITRITYEPCECGSSSRASMSSPRRSRACSSACRTLGRIISSSCAARAIWTILKCRSNCWTAAFSSISESWSSCRRRSMQSFTPCWGLTRRSRSSRRRRSSASRVRRSAWWI